MNQVTLVGRLGKPPEIRYTPKGVCVAKMSIATSRKQKEEWVTDWHQVVCFGKRAESLSNCQKGQKIFVSGYIETQTYEKEGVKKSYTQVVALEAMPAVTESEQQSTAPEPNDDRF